MHLHNFNNPFFQSKIIGRHCTTLVILIMAPFYCITSMGSFVFPVEINLDLELGNILYPYQGFLLGVTVVYFFLFNVLVFGI